jgi:L-alanine-DL-glutamate epimerase-like enolase superfamily enzyme
MNRRRFLTTSAIAAATTGALTTARARPASGPRLRITRIALQEAPGRRQTPIAPNASIPYRGYPVRETIVRLETEQGVWGFGRFLTRNTALLRQLLGLDPFALFEWNGDVIKGPAEQHRDLLQDLAGTDAAILDLLGRAMRRPVADLLGAQVRNTIPIYDSSLYMEDLLSPPEREGLPYIKDAAAKPAEFVAQKARWILSRKEGFKILKIKTGRTKWMPSLDDALQRDIEVFQAVRAAVGPEVRLFVDANNGYATRPQAAAEFALACPTCEILEEMFPEENLADVRELKRRLRSAGLKTRLGEGEAFLMGLREEYRMERFPSPDGDEPLFDIEQTDMNRAGYMRLRFLGRECARRKMTLAPHNFSSKLGFYTMVHLGLTVPNFDFCECDDTEIPAFDPVGLTITGGAAGLGDAVGLGVALREEHLQKPTLELRA